MTLLTLTVLWLDSGSIERMAMASMNFICHLLCIFDLHWQLPHNGENVPHICKYPIDLLIIIHEILDGLTIGSFENFSIVLSGFSRVGCVRFDPNGVVKKITEYECGDTELGLVNYHICFE